MKSDGVKAKIINVMGDLDENAVLRSNGLKKAAEEAGAKVLQDVPTGWNPDKALSGLSAALQAHPEATAVFVGSDHLIQGVRTAMERADRWAPRGDAKHLYLGSQDTDRQRHDCRRLHRRQHRLRHWSDLQAGR